MKKIKDRVMLGLISGLLAGVIGKATNAIEYKAGLTDLRYNQPAASLFLPKREVKGNTPQSKIIASLVNNTMIGVTGTLITYILSITGRDKAMVKGAGIGALQWIGIWGFLSKLGVTAKSNKLLTHVLSFIDHIIFGAAIGLLASKLGDDSLFPDKQANRGEKLPLITLGNQKKESVPIKLRRIKRHA